jgi:signal peptidase I
MSNASSPNPPANRETATGVSAQDGAKNHPQTQPKAASAPYAQLRLWLRDLTISLILAVFVIIFLYQPVKVEGTSMLPELQDQERIFINKFVYRLEPIERGDVVVFHFPRDTSKSYIKRVIGIAGDRIRIVDGEVYLNGQPQSESYVPPDYADHRSLPEITVPADSYFVLGDHRSMSNDSREFGAVERQYIYGKAVFVYWPMEKLGRVR